VRRGEEERREGDRGGKQEWENLFGGLKFSEGEEVIGALTRGIRRIRII